MGKKSAKRKTRWRVLPIGTEEGGSGSGNDDDDLGTYSRATQKRPARTHSGTNGGGGGGGGGGGSYYNNKQYYHPRSYGNHDHSQPLVTTEKQIFNEEEYTKITTPRQDVLFKKGYLGRKRPVVVPDPEATAATDAAAVENAEDIPDGEGTDGMEEQPQYIYTNGYMDHTGVYYINGSGYEMYDPYTGQVAVLVGPHYGHPGGPPTLLATVSCQPVPLQPLEWFNPPGFLPYVQAPCHPGQGVTLRDRTKRYSTDSQNCSPVSSESTGPPGSPQESDEMGAPLSRGHDPAASTAPPLVFPHPPPSYVYPGYMFGAPMYNMNGVTVQTTPNQAPSSDVTGKRRKKKRKRRRKVNGELDASEESSSEGGGDEKEDPHSLTCSQESSLESDSKHSLSSEDRLGGYPAAEPLAVAHCIVESVTKLNPRATDFTCTPRIKDVHVQAAPALTNGNDGNELNDKYLANGHSEEFKAEAGGNGVSYAKANGSVVGGADLAVKSGVDDKYSAVNGDSDRKPNAKTESHNHVANRPKLDFASVVSPKLNGHVAKQPGIVPSPPVADGVVNEDSFEQYEDFSHLNGFANGEVEEEWITVKPKPRKSESAVAHNGHPEKKELTNGHGKPFKDYRQTNGTTRGYKQQETRLYKTDVKYHVNGKVEEKFSVKKPTDGYVKDNKQNGKVRVNGKMEGNEKEDKGKERKTSSSSSEGKMETPPVKPSRRERKNKSISPPKTPETTSTGRPFVVGSLDRSLAVEEKATETKVSADQRRPPCVVDVVVKEAQQSSSRVEKLHVNEITVAPVNVPEISKTIETPRVEPAEKHVSADRLERMAVESPPVEKKTPPKVQSLKDLSTKTIVQEASLVSKSQPIESVPATTPDLSIPREEPTTTQSVTSSSFRNTSETSGAVTTEASSTFLAGETQTPATPNPQLTKDAVVVQVSRVGEPEQSSQDFISHEGQTKNDSDEELLVAPVAPPRRKKYRPLNQRVPERAPTPGKASDSDSSSSMESEASVIECLNAANDRSDQSGLSSSDEEVIYSGKLGVEQPKVLGKMKVPRSTWTSKSVTTEIELPTKSAPVVEEPPSKAVEVKKLAEEIVDSVIDEAVKETTRLKRPNLGITDAVTRWLRSQSPDVLSVSSQQDEMGDILEETEDELDGEREEDEDGSKNWERNPLPVPSVNGSVDYRRDGAGKRVANKITDEYLNAGNERVAAIANEINGGIVDINDVGVPKVNGHSGSGLTEGTDMKDKLNKCEDLNEIGTKACAEKENTEISVAFEETDANVCATTKTNEGNGPDERVRTDTGRQTAETDETKRFFQETVSETDETDKDELEWDTWDLTLNADRKPDAKYDPLANDTFQAVDGRQLDTPSCESPLDMCPKLYDANLSVAKYYNLAKTSSPAEEYSDSETDDLLRADGTSSKPDGYRVSLATELARLQQPLPPNWKVAPLVVKSPLPEVDSGVESGDDTGLNTATVAKKPSVFKRKLIGRLKGEGGPFPCGGVCCIVQ